MKQESTGKSFRNSEGFGNGRKPEGFRKREDFGSGRKPSGKRPASLRRTNDHTPVPKGGKKTPHQPMEGLASRRLALKVIRQVTEGGAYASLSLDAEMRNCGLSGADRRLAARLVYDTLDHLIYLDYVLGQVMAREDTDIRLRNILRLGACQLLLEDRIPESAATNTSVQLCDEIGMTGLKGVCNGILRNLIRKKDQLVFPDPETEPDLAQSIRLSVPVWLWHMMCRDYGRETAEKLLSWRNTEEGFTIRPNLTRLNDDEFSRLLEKKVWSSRKTELPHAWRVSGTMNIGMDADFLNGLFSIQSESSMMAAAAMTPQRGKQYLDCCAAPGGKTCYLAELMQGTGRVQAWDIHEHRVKLIESQVRRLGLENVRPMTRDAAADRPDLHERMDGVLLDAPCSGLGVLAEKPDIKLRIQEEQIRELTALQTRLLDTVCQYVRPEGTLVYSTCSLLKAENEEQIKAFLERHPEYECLPMPETIPERYRRHETVGLQLLPERDGAEGFYICRMRRKGGI